MLGLNLLVFLVLAGILATVIVSFRQTRHTMTTITQRDVSGIIANGRTGRELTSIFADLLTSIFYGDNDAGQAGLQRLDLIIQTLIEQSAAPQLQQALQEFAQQLAALLDRSAELKTLALKFSEQEEEFLFTVEMLNDVMTEKIDVSGAKIPSQRRHFEQLQSTVIGFRGAFNQIISQVTELQRNKAFVDQTESETQTPGTRAIESLDYLLLRFQGLTTTDDNDIVEFSTQLEETVTHYQDLVRQYQEAGNTFQSAFQNVTQSKDLVITALNEQDNRIVRAVREMEGSLASENQRFSRLIAMLAGLLFMVIIFSSYLVRKMVTPLGHLAQVAKRIAKGEVNVHLKEVSAGDEIGVLTTEFHTMIAQLTSVVLQVKTAAQDVAQRSREMNVVADQMSQGAAQQAAASEEVTASMEEMAANIHQTADNAKRTEQIAMTSAEDARAGQQAVTEIIQAMEVITERISVIQEIAGQTSILSLNATIEAAKAEEHGKGFAVVAASVRDLARESRTAADEIRSLVHSCVALSAQAGEVLLRLVPNSDDTAQLVQEISAASQEQTMGVEHVNLAVQQLDSVAQHTAATAEEVAVSAESLTAQADALQTAMAFFTLDETLLSPQAPDDKLLQRLQKIDKDQLVALLASALEEHSQSPLAISEAPFQTPGPSVPHATDRDGSTESDISDDADELDREFEHY